MQIKLIIRVLSNICRFKIKSQHMSEIMTIIQNNRYIYLKMKQLNIQTSPYENEYKIISDQ